MILSILLTLFTSFVTGQDRRGEEVDSSRSGLIKRDFRQNEFGKGGTKHKRAKKNISDSMSRDAGKPIHGEEYAEELADILGQLDSAALKRVLKEKLSVLE